MDKKLLFTAGLLALFGNQAFADKVELPTVPDADCIDPSTVLNGSGATFYLYNLQGHQFVIAGNNWGTRASFSASKAAEFKSEATTTTDVSSISLYNNGTGSWKKMFVDSSDGQTWMDYASQSNRNVEYVVNIADDNSFELYSYGALSTAVDGTVCVGWQKGLTGNAGLDAVNGLLKPADFTSTADYGTKWKCVSTSFDLALYSARLELGKAINEADDLGADVTEIAAVYNNSSATVDELNAATAKAAVLKRYQAISNSGANAENPFSLAAYIAPSTATAGWTVVGKAYDAQTKSYTVQETGDALTAGLNCWTSSSNGGHLADGSISQTLENLPNGVYEVSVDINASCGTNPNGTQTGTSLFANDKSANCSSVPDKPVHVTVKTVVTDGKLTFGIQTLNTTVNFIFFGNLKVNYLGVDTSALVESLNEKIAEAETYVADVKANADVVAALNQAIADAKDVAASSTATEDKITASVNALAEAKAAVADNISAYAALAEAKAAADAALETYTAEAGYSKAADLNALFTKDEKGNSYAEITEGLLYGTDDVKAYTQTVADYTAALAKSFTKEGTDVTYLLADPSFENGGAGWSGKTNNTKVDTSLKNCEAYHAAYDLYQVLTGLPNGVYELSAQAFERVGEYTTANYQAYLDGQENIDAYLYANDTQQPVCSAYSETMNDGGKNLDGKHFANSMSDFAAMSSEGNFWVTVKVPVTDGTLRVGIKCNSDTNWSIWDNFNLTYVSPNTLALYLEELNDAIADAETVGSDAAQAALIQALQKAVTDGKAVAEKADATKDEITAATETLKQATEAAKDNAQAYEELAGIRPDIDDFIEQHPADNYLGTAAFVKLVDETGDPNNGYTFSKIVTDKPYSTEELKVYVELLIQEMEAVKKTFTKPGTNITDILADPSFDDNAEGWNNPGDVLSTHAVEFYQKDYDMYQVIEGLPNGVYDVTVSGMQRKGNYSDAGYNVWKDKLENITAELYANDVVAPIKSAYDEYMTVASEYTDWRKDFSPTGTEGIYYPNCPATFQTASENGLYYNRVRVTVTDGTIRLGVRGTQAENSADWSIFDNFQLTYVKTQTYVIDPETEFNLQEMENVDVEIKRSFEVGKWTPICLPFSLDTENSKETFSEIVALDKVEGNRYFFSSADHIEAGRAYLVKAALDLVGVIYFDVDVTAAEPENGVLASGHGFQGTYSPIEVATDGTAMLVDATANPSVPTAETAKVLGTHAYIVVPNAEDASSVKIDINGTVTGLDAINASVVANGQKVYNVNGQCVGTSLQALPHGVYVVNGKKVVK